MSTYHAAIFNCPMMGDELSQTPEGGQVRNLIRITVGGLNLELLQRPALVGVDYSTLRGEVVHTTDLYIRDLAVERLGEAEATAHAIAWMLSLATSSEVVCPSYEFEGANPPQVARHFVARLEYFRPAFSLPLSHSLKTFLQLCFPHDDLLTDSWRKK